VIAKRLDNIDVLCTDVEPMRAFYADVLGLPLRLPYEPGQGWVGFRAGDVVIYLIEIESGDGDGGSGAPPPHPPPRFTGGANPPGIDSFAFEVDSLDAAIAELDGRGVSWAGEIVESEWYRYRGLHDPEGNLVYLTEPLLDRRDPPVPAPESGP
jgi:isopenicillin-N N-acyltransferase-like protein